MDERPFMLLDVSLPQWIASIGFVTPTVGFFVWVVVLWKKH